MVLHLTRSLFNGGDMPSFKWLVRCELLANFMTPRCVYIKYTEWNRQSHNTFQLLRFIHFLSVQILPFYNMRICTLYRKFFSEIRIQWRLQCLYNWTALLSTTETVPFSTWKIKNVYALCSGPCDILDGVTHREHLWGKIRFQVELGSLTLQPLFTVDLSNWLIASGFISTRLHPTACKITPVH